MITIKEIANKTGVSPATVSRVLNNDITLSVGDKTRERIVQCAKKYGYKTVNERKGRITISYGQPCNRRVGVAVMHNTNELLGDAYYMELNHRVDDVCFGHGISTVMVSRDDNGHFHTADTTGLDGLIAIGQFSKEEVKDFKKLTENIVFIECGVDASKYYSIEPNLSQGIKAVLNYCTERNIKSIAFCGPNVSYGEDRSLIPDPKYYIYKALLLVIYPFDYSLTITPEINHDCYNETIEFFKGRKRKDFPDVILVGNDVHVPGLMKALRELEIKVPEDIGIITMNNTTHSVNCDPPLTSVEMSPGEQAVSAIMCLQSLWQGILAPKKISVPCTIIERGSLLEPR